MHNQQVWINSILWEEALTCRGGTCRSSTAYGPTIYNRFRRRRQRTSGTSTGQLANHLDDEKTSLVGRRVSWISLLFGRTRRRERKKVSFRRPWGGHAVVSARILNLRCNEMGRLVKFLLTQGRDLCTAAGQCCSATARAAPYTPMDGH